MGQNGEDSAACLGEHQWPQDCADQTSNQIRREGDSFAYKRKLGTFFFNLITRVIESNRKKGSREREKKYIYIESESEVAQSCPTLCDAMGSSLHQAPPSMGFSRQEYWSGLPFPSPGNLPDPGIKPRSPTL